MRTSLPLQPYRTALMPAVFMLCLTRFPFLAKHRIPADMLCEHSNGRPSHPTTRLSDADRCQQTSARPARRSSIDSSLPPAQNG